MVNNLPANAGDVRDSFNPWVGKIPWRKKWQRTPGYLPGKSHGQRSLAGYSPWNHKRVREDLATEQQQQKCSIMLTESSLIIVREPIGSRKLECLHSNPVFAAKWTHKLVTI